jgi:hypothetical protein
METYVKEDFYQLDDNLIIRTENRFCIRHLWVKWIMNGDTLIYAMGEASIIKDSLILEEKWKYSNDETEFKTLKEAKEYLKSFPKWDKTKYWSYINSDRKTVV